jgi:hypothetical protein
MHVNPNPTTTSDMKLKTWAEPSREQMGVCVEGGEGSGTDP